MIYHLAPNPFRGSNSYTGSHYTYPYDMYNLRGKVVSPTFNVEKSDDEKPKTSSIIFSGIIITISVAFLIFFTIFLLYFIFKKQKYSSEDDSNWKRVRTHY